MKKIIALGMGLMAFITISSGSIVAYNATDSANRNGGYAIMYLGCLIIAYLSAEAGKNEKT